MKNPEHLRTREFHATRGKPHYWWLRPPGEDMSRVTVVSPNGLVYRSVVDVSGTNGVRPAMWVSLYKIQLWKSQPPPGGIFMLESGICQKKCYHGNRWAFSAYRID